MFHSSQSEIKMLEGALASVAPPLIKDMIKMKKQNIIQIVATPWLHEERSSIIQAAKPTQQSKALCISLPLTFRYTYVTNSLKNYIQVQCILRYF